MSLSQFQAPAPHSKTDKAIVEINHAINDANGKLALRLAVAALKAIGHESGAVAAGASGVALLVLKAQAHLMLGQLKEADDIAAHMLAHQRHLLRDRVALRHVTALLVRRHRHADAVALMDAAIAADSASLNAVPLLADLFAVHVRGADHKAAHLVAKRLHAVSKDVAHFRWSVVTLWLQTPLVVATAAPPLPAAALIPLKLALALLARDVAADSFDSFELLLVYCDALEQARDFPTLVATLRHPRTARLWREAVPNERLRRLAAALASARRWRAALAAYHTMLDADPDDWTAWCAALDAAARVADADALADDNDDNSNNNNDNGGVAGAPAECARRLLERARAAQSSHRSLRGPFLVELELRRRIDRGALALPVDAFARTWSDLLLWYFEAFGDKPCYVVDALPFVADVAELRAAATGAALFDALQSRVERAAPADARVEASDAETIRKCARWATQWSNIGLLREQLEAAPDDELLLARAADDMARFAATVKWQLPYEHRESPQVGDSLALLAARALLRLAARRDAGSAARLVHRAHAAALLASALRRSEHNFQFKLQLIVAFDAVAAYQAVHRFRDDLEMRHVQSESLSYLFLESAVACAMWREADDLCDELVRFHVESRKTVPDYLIECYQRQTYSRVRDLMSYDERLRCSHQLVVARTERALQRLATAGTALGAVRAALDAALAVDVDATRAADALLCETAEQAAALVANEDVASVASVFLCGRAYAPFTSAAVVGVAPEQRLLWLRLRGSLLRALRQTVVDAGVAPAIDAARALIEQLEAESGSSSNPAGVLTQYRLTVDALALAAQCKLAFGAPDEANVAALGGAVDALLARTAALGDSLMALLAPERTEALYDALTALQLGATVTTRFAVLAADCARRAAPPRRTKANGKLWPALREAAAHVERWRASVASDAKRLHAATTAAIQRVDASALPAVSGDVLVERSAAIAVALGDGSAVANAWTSVRASHSQTLASLATILHETARDPEPIASQ
jgi:hypothetical protein